MPELTPQPRVEKLAVIERALSYIAPIKPLTIVETGTGHGDLTCLLRNLFDRVITIELRPKFVQVRKSLYGGLPYVDAVTGDSREILPALTREINEPAVWYLDAHYCHLRSMPAGGGGDLPLLAEIDIIAKRPQPDVVIVDDVRTFGRVSPPGHPGAGWEGVTMGALTSRLGRVVRPYKDGECFVMIRS